MKNIEMGLWKLTFDFKGILGDRLNQEVVYAAAPYTGAFPPAKINAYANTAQHKIWDTLGGETSVTYECKYIGLVHVCE